MQCNVTAHQMACLLARLNRLERIVYLQVVATAESSDFAEMQRDIVMVGGQVHEPLEAAITRMETILESGS